MCSIAMPADYEMLVSRSPPIFSHSPPSDFLSRYESFARKPRNCKPLQIPPKLIQTSPRRPCLVIRPYEASEEDPTSPTKLKKKVVFADDRGMSLTHVRVMREPSNVPPVWSLRFLAKVTQGLSAEPVATPEQWEITFSQPASDYVEFRKKLENNKVSLENVILKDSENSLVGTIKVKNLAFEKVVFIRASSDNWKSLEDIHCTFVPNTSTNSIYILYDTFSFNMKLPAESNRLEFCVCYKCEESEFWDNNQNKNYIVTKRNYKSNNNNNITDSSVTFTIKSSDIFHAKVDSWSEFASWTHLENNNPYW